MMFVLDVLTAPDEEPLTLEEALLHLRVDDGDDNALVERLIEAARLQAENTYLWRALVTRGYRLTLLQAPRTAQIYLPMAPVQAVSSVLADGVAVVGYELFGGVGLLQLPPGTAVRDRLVVEYTAGYGDADAVPANFKQAMLLMIGHWYENREAVVLATQPAKLPYAVENLLLPHRAWRPG